MSPAWAILAALALAPAAAAPAPAPPAPAEHAAADTAVAAARCLYLPPAIERRVVFYHSFEAGPDRPEINTLGGRFEPGAATPCDGVAGRGVEIADGKVAGPLLRGLALPMHRPVTVMLWWQMRRELPIDGGFNVVSLRGPRGYVSNFVRGGPWCALKEPNVVLQVWNWPGISNVNDLRGPVERKPGPWRHAALVVSRASAVRVLWDGQVRADVGLKGRTFLPNDVVDALAFGGPGMRLDELLVLDVALDDAAVRDYLAAVRHLAAAGFPAVAPPGR